MDLTEGNVYHIYNWGINSQPIFSSPDNYIYFLKKVRIYLNPVCNILAYCLMPDHFHFLIQATEKSLVLTKAGALDMQSVSAAFKSLLSSYTKAYNKRYGRTGSLFVQNTHCKDVSFTNHHVNYAFVCFNYIHQNPWVAGMVTKIEDWHFSSFRDYIGIRNGTLCAQYEAYQILGLQKEAIYNQTYRTIEKHLLLGLT